MADWRVALLKARGYPVTKSNMNLLTAWQKMEGGGTHNDATFNPLNTTRNAPGAVKSINSVGVKAFDTFEHGIAATAATMDNYETISAYLKAGKGSDALSDPAGQGDFNMWVSGKDAPGASPYVTKIAGLLGQDVGNAKVTLGGQTYGGGRSPQAAQAKVADMIGAQKQMTAGFLMQAAHDTINGTQLGGGSLLSLAQARKALQEQADFASADLKTSAESYGANVSGDTYRGKALIPGIQPGTHVTDNLDWNNGAKTARDIMGDPGTPIGAPEDGYVERLGSAQGGGSMYFVGNSGRRYWLGHIDKQLPAGTRVRYGQPLAVISADHANPHLHFDYKQ